MKFYVTTLGRVNDQKTLANLPSDIASRVVLVVQGHEYKEHEKEWGWLVGEVRALPPSIRTLGPTRREVYSWREEDSIVMLDDDLDFYIRRDPSDWHLTTPTGTEMHVMFEEIQEALETLGYHHVGVSGREGNNRVQEYSVLNTRYMRLLAYRTDMPDDIEHGRIDGMSDFDVNLQLLRRGFPSYVFYRYAQGQKGTQTPGGCSLDRTLEKHEAEVDFMVREHSPFVKKRWKKNKTGGEFGERPEVTIYWKKAFDAGDLR